jgi:hypothetical protein
LYASSLLWLQPVSWTIHLFAAAIPRVAFGYFPSSRIPAYAGIFWGQLIPHLLSLMKDYFTHGEVVVSLIEETSFSVISFIF